MAYPARDGLHTTCVQLYARRPPILLFCIASGPTHITTKP